MNLSEDAKFFVNLIGGSAALIGLVFGLCFWGASESYKEQAKIEQACTRGGGKYVIDHYETSGSVVNGTGSVSTYPVYRCDKVTK